MSDGLDPEIAALLAQSGDGASAGEAPAESDAGFSFDSPSDGAAAEFGDVFIEFVEVFFEGLHVRFEDFDGVELHKQARYLPHEPLEPIRHEIARTLVGDYKQQQPQHRKQPHRADHAAIQCSLDALNDWIVKNSKRCEYAKYHGKPYLAFLFRKK